MKEREYKEHRRCAICGKDYVITNPRSKYCDRPHYKQCVICGKDMDYFYRGDCCSNKCRELKRKQTKLEKYGDENYHNMEKAKQTLLKNYGVENVYQLENVKAKIRKTNLERYGVENVYQRPDVRKNCMSKAYTKETIKKRKQTNLKRYGGNAPTSSEEIRDKVKLTNLKKYGVDNPLKSEIIKNRIRNKCIEKYGVPYPCMTNKCISKSGRIISKININAANKFKEYNIETEFEYHLEKSSYDLHILDTDILIEINPTVTHNSTIGMSFGKGRKTNPKSTTYHFDKSVLAMKHNFRCIHIFDWDDLDEVIDKYIINYNKKIEGIIDLSKEDMRLYTINNLVEDKHSVKLGKDLVDVYGVGLLKL